MKHGSNTLAYIIKTACSQCSEGHTNVSQSDEYKFCAFSGGSNTNSQHSDDVPPGFTKTHATKNRDRYNEKKRQKVVHGTTDSLNCFLHGGKSRNDNLQKFS